MDILKKMLEERNAQAIADKQAKMQDANDFLRNQIRENGDDLVSSIGGSSEDINNYRDSLDKIRNNTTKKIDTLQDLSDINADISLLHKAQKPFDKNPYWSEYSKYLDEDFENTSRNQQRLMFNNDVKEGIKKDHLNLLKKKLYGK